MSNQLLQPTINELFDSNFETNTIELQSAIEQDISTIDPNIRLNAASPDFYASKANITDTQLYQLAKKYGYEQNQEWTLIKSKVEPKRLGQNKLIVFILISILESGLIKSELSQVAIDYLNEFAINGFFKDKKMRGSKLREIAGDQNERELLNKFMMSIKDYLNSITKSKNNDIFSNIINAFSGYITTLDFIPD